MNLSTSHDNLSVLPLESAGYQAGLTEKILCSCSALVFSVQLMLMNGLTAAQGMYKVLKLLEHTSTAFLKSLFS